jgi:hypothetical protein
LGFGHELIAQFGFQLHREDGFLGHAQISDLDTNFVYTS